MACDQSQASRTLRQAMEDKDVDSLQLSQMLRDTQGGCEYEVTFNGESDLEKLYAVCQKHPGHRNFIPINRLNKEELPEGHQTNELVDLINTLAALTTRLTVNSVSPARPQMWPSTHLPYPCCQATDVETFSRTGTGLVDSVQKMFPAIHGDCPCPECTASGNPYEEWWEVRVTTATHLVFDDSEAQSTVAVCFPDHQDSSLFRTLHGVRVCSNLQRIENDWCVLTCVTHDPVLGQLLEGLLTDAHHMQNSWSRRTESFFRTHTLIISHPHGNAMKAITIGQIRHITIPVGPKYPVGQAVPFLPGTKYSTQAPSPCCSHENCSSDHPQMSHPGPIAVLQPTCSTGPWKEDILLPSNATFTLPGDAPFVRKHACSKPNHFTFPEGTSFSLADGRELPLPPDTEFAGWSLDDDMLISVSYSTQTCPGSSGATVFTLEPQHLQSGSGSRYRSLDTFVHSRSLSGGLNRSAHSFCINPRPNELIKNADASCVLRGKA